ncbi:type I DNA topoisomerase [Dehalococcoidia bacterium]|nr:type I DNA topoisomerase [Dehalococcoidia bacterium]
MAKELVIVESPAKARTISRILKDEYVVMATMGHVRDLPQKELGVDTGNGFAPKYVVSKGKSKIVSEIKTAARDASVLYLATDPDREGEAIAWHLIQAAELDKMPARRVVFHEITKEAVSEAFRHPKELDMKLVNAQQARRILDRLVGYKISPILWRKVRKGLSAGRVQSVAARMVIEREREIENFIQVEYWSIEAELKKTAGDEAFRAEFVGSGKGKEIAIASREEADSLSAELKDASYTVSQVQQKTVSRHPVAPFITSTLQQEAWRKLRFSAKRTMSVAQSLYEGVAIGEGEPMGLITYMRTDSTHVTTQAIAETREYITQRFGADFTPQTPRTFKKKVKGAQEAHEAIRPTSVRREPAMMQPYLTADQFKIYDLIWKRMVASQMAAALFDTVRVDIEADAGRNKYLFRTTSSSLSFPGFLTLYSEGRDEEENGDEKAPLPELAPGDALDLVGLFPQQHFTKPPPRYTEATLIKTLEENGIGRPSTYAPILSTIQERGYVEKEKGYFSPMELGIIVTDLLEDFFPEIVNIGFTAQIEERLDGIARGEMEWVPTLQEFYYPFALKVERAALEMPRVKPADQPTDELCDKCGRAMVIKQGRFGKFLSCSNYPKCKNARPLRLGINCPRCGANLVERRTKRKRIFYGCSGYPECDFALWEKPLSDPCPECGGLLVLKGRNAARCTACRHELSLEEESGEFWIEVRRFKGYANTAQSLAAVFFHVNTKYPDTA